MPETAERPDPTPDALTIPLDEQAARVALDLACASVGLDAQEAELVRIGENAVFRLSKARVVVRVARSASYLPAVEHQLAVARWLEAEGVPAVRALDVGQPVVVDGRVVAFWESVDERTRYGTTAELGEVLRRLHRLTPPDTLRLPRLEPFEVAKGRIDRVPIAAEDRAFLRDRCTALEDAYSHLVFAADPVVLHGDANVGNLLLDRHNQARLSDLDSFCVGPAEWDLVLTGMFYDRFGWHTYEEYADFVRSYGRDVMDWDGFVVLSDVRELLMIAWLAQNIHEQPAANEFSKRLDSMRRGGSRRDWGPF